MNNSCRENLKKMFLTIILTRTSGHGGTTPFNTVKPPKHSTKKRVLYDSKGRKDYFPIKN
jgi:hypothetical protein